MLWPQATVLEGIIMLIPQSVRQCWANGLWHCRFSIHWTTSLFNSFMWQKANWWKYCARTHTFQESKVPNVVPSQTMPKITRRQRSITRRKAHNTIQAVKPRPISQVPSGTLFQCHHLSAHFPQHRTYILGTGSGDINPGLREECAGAQHEDNVEHSVNGVLCNVPQSFWGWQVVTKSTDGVRPSRTPTTNILHTHSNQRSKTPVSLALHSQYINTGKSILIPPPPPPKDLHRWCRVSCTTIIVPPDIHVLQKMWENQHPCWTKPLLLHVGLHFCRCRRVFKWLVCRCSLSILQWSLIRNASDILKRDDPRPSLPTCTNKNSRVYKKRGSHNSCPSFQVPP